MAALVTLEALVIILLAVLVAGLLRSHARILAALHELGVSPQPAVADQGRQASEVLGRPAPDLVGLTPSSQPITIPMREADADTLILFASGGCSTCSSLLGSLARSETPAMGQASRVVVVTRGADRETPSRITQMAPPGVPVVMSSKAWSDYRVPGAPYFVLVDGTGAKVAGEGSARTWAEVESLMGDAARDRAGAGLLRREERVDAELAAAGILPGDPRLHHPSLREQDQ